MVRGSLRLSFVLAGLAALVALAGCRSAPPPERSTQARTAAKRAAGGGTAVLGSITDVDSWNEYLSRQDFAAKLHRRIYLRLATETGDDREAPPQYEPQLAESWEFSEDGLALTFHLRDARWSDGRPITADDVRFTWEAQTSDAVAWANAGTKQHITDVEVVDERTVTFHFDRRYPARLADAVEGGILARHVHGAIPFEQWHEYDWSSVHVGSGPFLLERHAPGQEIVLQRNPGYWREGLPVLDRVVVRIVPDAANLVTQLLSGDIDYFEGLAPRDAYNLTAKKGVKLVTFDYPKYDFVGWNGARPPFNDPRIRRALTLAIDREALVDDLLYGYGSVGKGPVLSYSWGADRTIEAWPYDPDEARRILAEAGYATPRQDGASPASGNVLELELLTNAGNSLREAVAVKIQEQLARVGVNVRLHTLEMGALIGRCTDGDFDAYLGGWTILGRLDLETVFGSEATPPHGVNVVAFDSPEVDRLLHGLNEAEDWSTMKPALDRIQQRIHQEQPYTFLYESKRVAAIGPRLEGLEIDNPADPLAGLERCRVLGT